jgi:DNA-directed RNA polymerase specialized sigma subunit
VLDVAHVIDVDGETADVRVQRSELTAVLAEELSRLDSRDALLLTLRFEEDLPAARIASVMGFPSQFHVYRRLRTVLGDLRRQLQRRGVDGPAA